MSRRATITGILLAGAAAYGAMLPAPPWSAQQRGPTCAYEITVYLADTLPYLDADVRERVADMLERGTSPAYALALVQTARWQARIAASTAPWDLGAGDSCTADAQLRHNLASLGSQLDVLTTSNATGQPPLSVRAALSALRLLEELKQRVANTNDSLGNLEQYAPLFRLRGAPMTVFWWARHMVSQGDFARAKNLFELLVAPANPDGFTLGNSHYWLGVLLHQIDHQSNAALPHFLEVHRHPACLVFIDAAYCKAAELYRLRGLRDTAQALYAIRIPSIDYHKNELYKSRASNDLARETGDVTNQVRQLMRLEDLAAGATYFTPAAAQLRTEVAGMLSPAVVTAITAQLSLTMPFDLYTMTAIGRALTGPDAATNDAALTDMLLHDWPSIDWVAEHNPVIITNRVLSNNIFEQKRRTRLITPLP